MSRLVESIDALDSSEKKECIDWYLLAPANSFSYLSVSGKVNYLVGEYLYMERWGEDAKEESSEEA